MPNITANDIAIEFDTFGDQSNDPVLLIMGFGAQMTLWDENFCQMIADAGHYVIRFDNRDVGLSTKLDDAGTPSLADLFSGTFTPAYSLLDMANDAAGLLDALEIRSAHIVGASMGGMIAQTFAIAHPAKTRTLTSIMSTTGNPLVGQPSPDALAALTAPTATSRAEAIEQAVLATKVIGSPAYPAAEDEVREKAAAAYDRSFYPDGRSRQLAAILTQPDRTEALAALSMPTLVIHGAADPLVAPSGGEATAAAIPGASLTMIPGMGHDLPAPLHAEVVARLAAHFASANG